MKARGLPSNVVYAARAAGPVEASALGAAVARLGGVMVLVPDGTASAARQAVDRLGVAPSTDRVVVLRQPSAKANTALIALEVFVGLLGLGLLVAAAARRRRRSDASPTTNAVT